MVRILNLDNEYVKKSKYVLVKAGRNLKDAIFTTEIIETRQVIGQINWLATQTRLELLVNLIG